MPRRKKTAGAVLERPTKENRTPFRSIEDVLKKKNAPIEQKRIALELMSIMGGERGLAEKIMAEYNELPAGSIARIRLYELLLRLVKSTEPKEITGDLDYVSEDDIARMLREQVSHSEIQLGYPTHVCI